MRFAIDARDLQPEGLSENSRGSKRSEDPQIALIKDGHPGGVQHSSSLTPSGSQKHFVPDSGVRDLQPEGLSESSRGSKQSGDPRIASIKDPHPDGVQHFSSLTPSGSSTHFPSDPGDRPDTSGLNPRLLSCSPSGCLKRLMSHESTS
jgi:hypothetical protein